MNSFSGTLGVSDEQFMRRALSTALHARLVSRPNPWVGAVVVGVDGSTYEGCTSAPGGPHGEIVALQRAGVVARGATLYTTLEPCSHIGRTGPCATAIVEAGVSRVVIGITDPDTKVSGRGIALLREAGLDVTVGVLAGQVASQLAPYIHHRTTGTPFVVLKMASTIDGKTAASNGTSQWITGAAARQRVHELRAESDAILVGAGTVRADNPSLTVRDANGPSPRRIVLGAAPREANVHPCTEYSGDIPTLLAQLGSQDVLQLLVEGGHKVAGEFHRAGLVNRYIFHIAPAIAGGDDAPGIFGGAAATDISAMWRGSITSVQQLDGDLEVVVEPRKESQ